MKIKIVQLQIGIITHKKVYATVKDSDVEEESVSVEARLKYPLLAVQCTITCDEPIIPGGIYIDDHGQSWRAYDDTLDGVRLDYLSYDSRQFWDPKQLTLAQTSFAEGKS